MKKYDEEIMPEVNGKKYPYTAKGKAAAKKAAMKSNDRPSDDYYIDESGIRHKNMDWQQWDSSQAKRRSTEARKGVSAKKSANRTALKKLMDEFKRTGKIPGSPTN